MNMKNCCHSNVRKHREIKGSEKYVTLDISLKFYSLDKMRITYSASKVKLGRSGKGLITSLVLKSKKRPKKYKNSRYAVVNVSKKDHSRFIREFENFPYEIYDKKRPKHEPSGIYFYLGRHLAKCMMRADALKSDSFPVITEMTGTKRFQARTFILRTRAN